VASNDIDHPRIELFGVIFWPAFLAATITVGIVFTLIDPENIHLFGSSETVSRQVAYTVGFFAFWALYSLACLTSVWLHRKNIEKS
jgi:glycerol-3-phosphate acyltransferase PlsY